MPVTHTQAKPQAVRFMTGERNMSQTDFGGDLPFF